MRATVKTSITVDNEGNEILLFDSGTNIPSPSVACAPRIISQPSRIA
jgi:hypothetical protein